MSSGAPSFGDDNIIYQRHATATIGSNVLPRRAFSYIHTAPCILPLYFLHSSTLTVLYIFSLFAPPPLAKSDCIEVVHSVHRMEKRGDDAGPLRGGKYGVFMEAGACSVFTCLSDGGGSPVQSPFTFVLLNRSTHRLTRGIIQHVCVAGRALL